MIPMSAMQAQEAAVQLLQGLQASTSYTLWLLAEDGHNNTQAAASQLAVTTVDLTPPAFERASVQFMPPATIFVEVPHISGAPGSSAPASTSAPAPRGCQCHCPPGPGSGEAGCVLCALAGRAALGDVGGNGACWRWCPWGVGQGSRARYWTFWCMQTKSPQAQPFRSKCCSGTVFDDLA